MGLFSQEGTRVRGRQRVRIIEEGRFYGLEAEVFSMLPLCDGRTLYTLILPSGTYDIITSGRDSKIEPVPRRD